MNVLAEEQAVYPGSSADGISNSVGGGRKGVSKGEHVRFSPSSEARKGHYREKNPTYKIQHYGRP